MFGFDKTNQSTLNIRLRNIVFAFLLTLIFCWGCTNGEKGSFSVLPAFLRSTESRVSDLYINYVKRTGIAEFALATSFQKNEIPEISNLSKKIIGNPDLLFFPATLSQLYILMEKESWERQAIAYSNEFQKAASNSNIVNGEVIQSVFLAQYKLNRDEKILSDIVNALSLHISDFETKDKGVFPKNNLDLLLENKVMFIASKETGDPVFRNFALENTSSMYEESFKKDLRIMSVLTNDISIESLRLLRTEDFYKLAVGMCGFYELYKETGIEDYLNYCNTIAGVFMVVFNDDEVAAEIVNCIDLLSQSLVCLALSNLSEHFNDSYQKTSSDIYQNILQQLELPKSEKEYLNREERNSEESFRLYYYLLEYEIQKQNEL